VWPCLLPLLLLKVESGAQVIQYFESWAHHLAPHQFDAFAKPYANKAMAILKAKHPTVPIIYFANGGSAYLDNQVWGNLRV
jgi:uroporphyrinogen-III decarboxylase